MVADEAARHPARAAWDYPPTGAATPASEALPLRQC